MSNILPKRFGWREIWIALVINWIVLGVGFFAASPEARHQLHQFYTVISLALDRSISSPEEETGRGATFWAKEVQSGGLILFFRHAEREKWDSNLIFDHFEVLDGVDGRDQSWSKAVCLSEKGREEAGIISRAFSELEVPVSRVFSSPSCRAQETARLGFGRVDGTWTSLLHSTAIPSNFHEEFGIDLRNRVLSHLPAQGEKGNLVLSSHGQVLAPHSEILFGETSFEVWEVGETGFIVIEPVSNGDRIDLVPRFAFNTFLDFWLAANDYSLLRG